MTISEADSLFATPARVKALKSLLQKPSGLRLRLNGLQGSAPAMLLASLAPARPALAVADDADTAGYLYHDLCQILGEEKVAILTSAYKRDIRYGQIDPPSQILRTETLDAYSSGRISWVISYPEALAEKVAEPERLADSRLRLKSGARQSLTDTVARLVEEGFCKVDYVYEPGQFAHRGSILDIYSYSNEHPYRIDFFDDEIDSIRTFNVETQLSAERLKEAVIIPALSADTSAKGISMLDFIAPSTPIFVQSAAWLMQRVRAVCSEKIADAVLIAGEGDADALKKLVDGDRFCSRLMDFPLIEYGQSDSLTDLQTTFGGTMASLDYNCSPQALYHKNFNLIADSFTSLEAKGYRILILTDSPHQSDRLREIFDDRGDNIRFTPVDRTIHQGFIDHDSRICFFTDHQIFDRFHKYNLRSERARGGKLALSLRELNQIEPGDYIVHIDHGIGRFAGLIHTNVNGRPQEMIKLLYQNDDIILVSIHALHKLSKYRGKEGIPPKINKLGTGAWNRLKERTKSRVKDIARDLIKLYAARREEKGFAFSPDTYMQHELEASFIYEDTPDQLKATQAVKADMEATKPMDRLICGDVGFGKTEIAIRAAFKAAADGKQTAVLVPTTVLAMQHYRTFSQRLKDMPVRVDFISRARKPKDVKQILADLEAGKIDILIGTHKLIGKTVKFKDLGLLVIDEEQKFGVAVKEKLKQMKVNVDTLTMSATPIPRTLQFSLMGARDLSSLNTPPANRQPIETVVAPLDDDMLREAVSFELSRGGQVFIVNNRIEGLVELENRLRRLVPNIRIVVGHGQMPPEKLEKAIIDFADGDYDVLLSTTIVENGIDMPNVNTIIVNNAHRFGLSELHQLRGRVGRSSRKAFCYLMIPPGGELTPVAHRRLQAIESFSDLGAGIQIAMQDLDIRGAGNLLGAEQSGFIADLGFETYQRILKESVLELKTEEFGETFADTSAGQAEEFVADCTVESDLELRLPPSYVPQESERISLYQQLDNMERTEQIENFRANLRDRFGEIPEPSEELIRIVPLRMAARRLGVERILLKGGKMYVYFVGDDNKAYYQSKAFGRMITYLQLNPKRVNIRQKADKRSFLIDRVPTVKEALSIFNTIEGLPAS